MHPPAAAPPRSRPSVYGLDIETDTSVDGLDPSVARIIAVAVAGPGGVRVFDDRDEALLLDRVDWHLASLEPGVLATWNGGAFDLPFLADRCRANGVRAGLRLTLDPTIPVRHPLPGHQGAYRGSWHGHAHLDAYQLFRADVVPALGVSGGLKTIARLCGLDPVELRAPALHTYAKDQVSAYVGSDARCTRELVLRRWPAARSAVDHPIAAPRAPAARLARPAPGLTRVPVAGALR
jgi:hypothetical protein